MNKGNKQNVEKHNDDAMGLIELFGRETIENLQEAISKVTGLGVVTADFRGEPLTEMTSFTHFCQHVRKAGYQKRLCNLSDASGIIQSAVTEKYCIYFCPCGLMEVAIPIIVHNRFLGGFLAGQVQCFDAPEDIPRFSSFIHSPIIENQSEEVQNLFKEIPVCKYKEFVNIAELIFLIINQLAEKQMIQSQEYNKENLEKEKLSLKLNEIQYENMVLESKLLNIKAQMSPPFMMNMLTNIANLSVMEDAPKTNEMTIAYAEFVKYNICQDAGIGKLISEIENIERFMKIMSIQYEDRFSYSVHIQKGMEFQKIPRYILMPYIQKGFQYLLKNSSGKFRMEITSFYKDEVVFIHIKNIGETEHETSEVEDSGYSNMVENEVLDLSLENARRRMNFLFGDDFDFIEQKTKSGTIEYTIKFPVCFKERVI
ncbi:MAG: PocR ligand-binding domain-containing protein [Oliverpabstia sp.]